MREFNNNRRTHTKDGQELSEMFIGEDGVLSIFLEDDECEVVGFISTLFCDAFKCCRK